MIEWISTWRFKNTSKYQFLHASCHTARQFTLLHYGSNIFHRIFKRFIHKGFTFGFFDMADCFFEMAPENGFIWFNHHVQQMKSNARIYVKLFPFRNINRVSFQSLKYIIMKYSSNHFFLVISANSPPHLRFDFLKVWFPVWIKVVWNISWGCMKINFKFISPVKVAKINRIHCRDSM